MEVRNDEGVEIRGVLTCVIAKWSKLVREKNVKIVQAPNSPSSRMSAEPRSPDLSGRG